MAQKIGSNKQIGLQVTGSNSGFLTLFHPKKPPERRKWCQGLVGISCLGRPRWGRELVLLIPHPVRRADSAAPGSPLRRCRSRSGLRLTRAERAWAGRGPVARPGSRGRRPWPAVPAAPRAPLRRESTWGLPFIALAWSTFSCSPEA